MDAYEKFVGVYDRLMLDVPYGQIAELIDREIKAQKLANRIVLDLACGTGTLTGLLRQK
ncbi:MAG: hypothetical protein ACLVG9_02355 [Eubacteriales bacterium]